ncbi:unnamed protein product, partial [Ectocarpus sp. 6 AP-2014]
HPCVFIQDPYQVLSTAGGWPVRPRQIHGDTLNRPRRLTGRDEDLREGCRSFPEQQDLEHQTRDSNNIREGHAEIVSAMDTTSRSPMNAAGKQLPSPSLS